eukprot:TRINITY_DN2787_c0_g1_i1.p1 TRINITY_DN2787_c0_g1~~TRINITY_DN2787_c0_g1_i1.p1  ORF type:complete len:1464 (+),score=433.23 TRINITY_DN2787_c0_g1_i1:121-4512(+)
MDGMDAVPPATAGGAEEGAALLAPSQEYVRRQSTLGAAAVPPAVTGSLGQALSGLLFPDAAPPPPPEGADEATATGAVSRVHSFKTGSLSLGAVGAAPSFLEVASDAASIPPPPTSVPVSRAASLRSYVLPGQAAAAAAPPSHSPGQAALARQVSIAAPTEASLQLHRAVSLLTDAPESKPPPPSHSPGQAALARQVSIAAPTEASVRHYQSVSAFRGDGSFPASRAASLHSPAQTAHSFARGQPGSLRLSPRHAPSNVIGDLPHETCITDGSGTDVADCESLFLPEAKPSAPAAASARSGSLFDDLDQAPSHSLKGSLCGLKHVTSVATRGQLSPPASPPSRPMPGAERKPHRFASSPALKRARSGVDADAGAVARAASLRHGGGGGSLFAASPAKATPKGSALSRTMSQRPAATTATAASTPARAALTPKQSRLSARVPSFKSPEAATPPPSKARPRYDALTTRHPYSPPTSVRARTAAVSPGSPSRAPGNRDDVLTAPAADNLFSMVTGMFTGLLPPPASPRAARTEPQAEEQLGREAGAAVFTPQPGRSAAALLEEATGAAVRRKAALESTSDEWMAGVLQRQHEHQQRRVRVAELSAVSADLSGLLSPGGGAQLAGRAAARDAVADGHAAPLSPIDPHQADLQRLRVADAEPARAPTTPGQRPRKGEPREDYGELKRALSERLGLKRPPPTTNALAHGLQCSSGTALLEGGGVPPAEGDLLHEPAARGLHKVPVAALSPYQREVQERLGLPYTTDLELWPAQQDATEVGSDVGAAEEPPHDDTEGGGVDDDEMTRFQKETRRRLCLPEEAEGEGAGHAAARLGGLDLSVVPEGASFASHRALFDASFHDRSLRCLSDAARPAWVAPPDASHISAATDALSSSLAAALGGMGPAPAAGDGAVLGILEPSDAAKQRGAGLLGGSEAAANQEPQDVNGVRPTSREPSEDPGLGAFLKQAGCRVADTAAAPQEPPLPAAAAPAPAPLSAVLKALPFDTAHLLTPSKGVRLHPSLQDGHVEPPKAPPPPPRPTAPKTPPPPPPAKSPKMCGEAGPCLNVDASQEALMAMAVVLSGGKPKEVAAPAAQLSLAEDGEVPPERREVRAVDAGLLGQLTETQRESLRGKHAAVAAQQEEVRQQVEEETHDSPSLAEARRQLEAAIKDFKYEAISYSLALRHGGGGGAAPIAALQATSPPAPTLPPVAAHVPPPWLMTSYRTAPAYPYPSSPRAGAVERVPPAGLPAPAPRTATPRGDVRTPAQRPPVKARSRTASRGKLQRLREAQQNGHKAPTEHREERPRGMPRGGEMRPSKRGRRTSTPPAASHAHSAATASHSTHPSSQAYYHSAEYAERYRQWYTQHYGAGPHSHAPPASGSSVATTHTYSADDPSYRQWYEQYCAYYYPYYQQAQAQPLRPPAAKRGRVPLQERPASAVNAPAAAPAARKPPPAAEGDVADVEYNAIYHVI